MATISESPVEQFRSNVQWFLEGNTPTYQTEMIVNLLVCLKTLANQLKVTTIENLVSQETVNAIAEQFSNITRRQLEDATGLNQIITALNKIESLKQKSLTDNKAFRETVVQLIVVAEKHPDISFKRQVLELTNSL